MLSNEFDTLYKKPGVSSKKVQRKTAVQTKQAPKKKRESEDYIALILEETKVLKHKLKIHQT